MKISTFTAPHLAYEQAKKLQQQLLADGVPVQQMYLYGSFARETATPQRDIDVLVVVPFPKEKPWELESKVWKMATEIDARMETVCLSPEQFDERLSTLTREVKHYGIPVR